MSAVVKHESESQVINMTPLDSVRLQMAECTDLARLEKLMELEKRWHDEQAERAYVAAFAAFKKNMPDVVKDMLNKQYGSDYSSLANLVNTTNKVLGEYGLNASWDPDQSGPMIKITCILTHVGGHKERVSISGPPDTSGQKNPLQQIKSTLTYLEGATFQAITGVVARSASTDDDGNGAGKKDSGIQSPEGYDNWRADMTAKADEGSEKLQESWTATTDDFRRHVIKHDELWWNETKRKASKASKAMKEQVS